MRRVVALSASCLAEGDPMTGQVHRHLLDRTPEWVVLRSTWFVQNLSEGQHLPTIRDEGAIHSATGDGRMPFMDAADIAAMAALTDPAQPNGSVVLTGPEALPYDDVVRVLLDEFGRSVTRWRLDGAAMDTAIAQSSEDRVADAAEHRGVWLSM